MGRTHTTDGLAILCHGCTGMRDLARVGSSREFARIIVDADCLDCGTRVGVRHGGSRVFPPELLVSHPRRVILYHRAADYSVEDWRPACGEDGRDGMPIIITSVQESVTCPKCKTP
jgi:hypothetical protein